MTNDLFIKILTDHKERIYRMCKAHAATPDDAKDIFQEVLINIWQSLPSYQHRSSVLTWVYRITVNVCLRAKHKDTARKNRFAPGNIQLESLHIATGQPEKYEELYMCIQKLGDTDKSLIMMYLEDISYKEMANVTGLTENNIAVKILRIKNKLYTCLKPQNNGK